jgi:hypothetical protein
MPLSVIGSGWGRTGTMSLKLALERLGFGPCYHMKEVFENLDTHVPIWDRAATGDRVDWDALFEGYSAAVDFPASSFYAELAERYPSAKVVHTARDPERWYRSFCDTIRHPLTESAPEHLAAWGTMVRKAIVDRVFHGDINSKADVLDSYARHNEAVQRTIPAERLLVYDVSQGWEPLCAFLEVGVPDEPFPRTNSTEEWHERIGSMLKA